MSDIRLYRNIVISLGDGVNPLAIMDLVLSVVRQCTVRNYKSHASLDQRSPASRTHAASAASPQHEQIFTSVENTGLRSTYAPISTIKGT